MCDRSLSGVATFLTAPTFLDDRMKDDRLSNILTTVFTRLSDMETNPSLSMSKDSRRPYHWIA